MFNDLMKRSSQWFRAEFVPGWIQYTWVYIYATWNAIFAWHPLWFTATNPWFPLWGLYPSSKRDILIQLPKQWTPKSCLVEQESITTADPKSMILDMMEWVGIAFPAIIKPDNGLRGLGVVVLHSEQELQEKIIDDGYFETEWAWGAWLIQEFIDHPLEVGVFYVRMPWEDTGMITGLVAKEFIQAHGDGVHTLEQLVEVHPRASLHVELLSTQFADRWKSVIPEWTAIDLVEIGTHSKGSTFVDASDQITPGIVKVFDEVSSYVDGFNYGRYDVRVASWEALVQWDFKVIELNATYSEPTWMYDPEYSFWQAQKILLCHHALMYKIAKKNHARGVPYANIADYRNAKKQLQVRRRK